MFGHALGSTGSEPFNYAHNNYNYCGINNNYYYACGQLHKISAVKITTLIVGGRLHT